MRMEGLPFSRRSAHVGYLIACGFETGHVDGAMQPRAAQPCSGCAALLISAERSLEIPASYAAAKATNSRRCRWMRRVHTPPRVRPAGSFNFRGRPWHTMRTLAGMRGCISSGSAAISCASWPQPAAGDAHEPGSQGPGLWPSARSETRGPLSTCFHRVNKTEKPLQP